MQFFLFCFFVISVICLILGFRKSSFGPIHGVKQHCTACGWTKEKVQLCYFEQHHNTKVATLCFDCSLEYDAIPLRDTPVDTTGTAWA